MTYVLMCLEPETQSLNFALDARGLISLDGGWETPVLFSLGTNLRLPGVRPDDPQGWWGDDFPDDRFPNDKWGSIIWSFLEQGVLTASVVRKVQTATQASLKWMVDNGVASKVVISAEIEKAELLALTVRIFRNNTQAFSKVWRVHIDAI